MAAPSSRSSRDGFHRLQRIRRKSQVEARQIVPHVICAGRAGQRQDSDFAGEAEYDLRWSCVKLLRERDELRVLQHVSVRSEQGESLIENLALVAEGAHLAIPSEAGEAAVLDEGREFRGEWPPFARGVATKRYSRQDTERGRRRAPSASPPRLRSLRRSNHRGRTARAAGSSRRGRCRDVRANWPTTARPELRSLLRDRRAGGGPARVGRCISSGGRGRRGSRCRCDRPRPDLRRLRLRSSACAGWRCRWRESPCKGRAR